MAKDRDDLKAPPGKFLVVLIDEDQDGFWPQGDYNMSNSATREADRLNELRTGPFGTYYTVFNDMGQEDPHIYIPPRLRKR